MPCHEKRPLLGNLILTKIAPLHIEEFVQAKMARKLSNKTVRNILVILQGVFNVAVDQDVIQRSPVRKAHRPEIRRKQKGIWSPYEVRMIIEAFPAAFKTLITVVALTGIRVGELLALQWKHVDFQSGTIHIAQSLWHGQVVSPKTEGSVRMIPLGRVLCGMLMNHYRNAHFQNPDDFIFCKEDGAPLHPDVVRKDVLYPTLDRLGIDRRSRESGFHAFRHCAASIINNETGNLKLVQNLLGHTNLSTTADIYTHTMTEAKREASETLEKVIFGNLFPVVPNLPIGRIPVPS